MMFSREGYIQCFTNVVTALFPISFFNPERHKKLHNNVSLGNNVHLEKGKKETYILKTLPSKICIFI